MGDNYSYRVARRGGRRWPVSHFFGYDRPRDQSVTATDRWLHALLLDAHRRCSPCPARRTDASSIRSCSAKQLAWVRWL